MRFVLAGLALMLGTQVEAATLICFGDGWTPDEAVCTHPLATTLPYDEIHMSQPGKFNAQVSFSAPLASDLTFTGLRYFHYDEYNDLTGYLFSGTDSYQGDAFLSYLLPAGLTGFSFQYTIPEFTFQHYPQGQGAGFPSTAVIGSVNQFLFESVGLPRVSMNISPVASAVPEPASWMMMLLGFGACGVALRHRKVATAAA